MKKEEEGNPQPFAAVSEIPLFSFHRKEKEKLKVQTPHHTPSNAGTVGKRKVHDVYPYIWKKKKGGLFVFFFLCFLLAGSTSMLCRGVYIIIIFFCIFFFFFGYS